MVKRSILYFDKAPGEYRQVIESRVPDGFEVWYWEEMIASEQQEKLPQADYLLVVSHKLNASLLTQAKQARYIQRTGAGVNNIDVETATKLGLPVCVLPGGNSTAVAELTILLILALYRNLVHVDHAMKQGRWPNWEFRPNSYEMDGKIHGLIGFGHIGREAAQRSRAFGTKIVYYDQYRVSAEVEREIGAEYVPLEDLLKQADIVSIHVPLLPSTRGLIGMDQLKSMKKNALLINVARGGIVNDADLYTALKDGIIAGAGIDTWESEPTTADNPLLTLDNVIAMPHIAAGTIDTFGKVIQLAFHNIVKAELDQRPDYVVNGLEKSRDREQ